MVKYIDILIGNEPVDLTSIENLPLAISYKMEDKQDFTRKQGSNALSVVVPATKQNDKVANSYHNPSIEDLTAGQVYRSIRDSTIRIAGQELLVGKAFLKTAKHKGHPTEYEYDFYGNNSDWLIDLKTSTLYDFLQHITYIFTKQGIIDSWAFNGMSEALPYVFIPIRYGLPMETFESLINLQPVEDYNMRPDYMKPSISKYWLIYWGFKSLGYKVKSDFFDTPYFRRQIMPWTWGNYLNSDGTKLDVLRFLAKSAEQIQLTANVFDYIDVQATNDSINGAFDNSNTYDYIVNRDMRWTYPAAATTGILEATFHLNVFVDATVSEGSYIHLYAEWWKNGVLHGKETLLDLTSPILGPRRKDFVGSLETWHSITVNPGDVVILKIQLDLHDSLIGNARIKLSIDTFEIAYFRTPIGGTINFANFLSLKNYKFLDFLAGVVDEFDLVFQTDSSTKTVYFEPAHPYSITNDLSILQGGYYNEDFLDWTDKQDLSKESMIENFTDSERELYFKYRDDSNDGTLKKVQDRDKSVIGQAKYVFPDRFAVGKREIENRFFAPTMHYLVEQWRTPSSGAPQMIILVPENQGNLSRDEAQNTFSPKSIYYKGVDPFLKFVFDGQYYNYPYGFAVNYKPGGENDPILSYSDELINGVVGKGLLRRFYLQRLAIMANGQYYTTWFILNNRDATNFMHREHIIVKGQRWELMALTYHPLKKESSQVLLKKWSPITHA